MKLITLNIWGGRLMQNALAFLEQEQADIINLQEVFTGGGEDFFQTLETLQDCLAYPYSYFEPTMSFTFSSIKPSFGMCILSKYPIKKKDHIFTNLSYQDNFDFAKDDINIRILQHAQIDINGELINDFNYHGYWISGSKEGNNETLKHSHIILDYMSKFQGKKILTGDFNLLPDSESIELINHHYNNLIFKYNIKTTRNMFSKNANQAIDFIFISDDIKEKSFRVSKEIVSDHQPVIIEI